MARLDFSKRIGVRHNLLRLLSERGVQPAEDWISVGVAPEPSIHPMYTVRVTHSVARAAVAGVLRNITGRVRVDKDEVWVLSEEQASALLAGRE